MSFKPSHLVGHILLLVFLFGVPVSAQDFRRICGKIFIDKKIDFTENEETLLCGDDTNAWEDIPLNQAQYHLNIFLQQRGYFDAEFETDYEENRLNALVGRRNEIKKVFFVGHPDSMDPSKRRKLIGQPLTPDQLNTIESWTIGELGNLGYPCAEVNLVADPKTGEVRVGVAPGIFQTFHSLERENVSGMDETALKRYDAFHLGDPYDASLLRLTSNRIMIDGLMPSTYFITSCTPEGAKLTQRLITGEPHLVTVEVGASTEVGPIVRARWKNTRLGRLASSITARISASPKVQSASVGGEAYYDKNNPGLHYAPELLVVRESETDYTSVTTQLRSPLGYLFDRFDSRFRVLLGPTIENKDKVSGDVGQDSTYVTVDTVVEAMSHDYESYQGDPRTGYYSLLELSMREKGFFADLTAHQLAFEFKRLFNYNHYEPPLFITGVRLRYEGLFVNDLSEARRILTEDTFYRLGGDSDIRGFSRDELDGPGGLGYLTTLYAGIEGRLVEELPYGIQPFVFLDAAKVGAESYTFSDPTYWSPGIGIRWATAFGIFRGTAGHGYVTDLENASPSLTEWTYFLSYGREF